MFGISWINWWTLGDFSSTNHLASRISAFIAAYEELGREGERLHRLQRAGELVILYDQRELSTVALP